MPDGRLQKSTGYSTHPPTVRVRRRLANLPPEQQRREKARRHEYNAIWNMCARTSKKKEYEKASISAKRNMLLTATKSLMARRVKNGSVICGIDLEEMVKRHLNKEAEQRATERGKRDHINLKGIAVDTGEDDVDDVDDADCVDGMDDDEVDDDAETKGERLSPFNMLLGERQNNYHMPPAYKEDHGEGDQVPAQSARGLFPDNDFAQFRYNGPSNNNIASPPAEEQLQAINQKLYTLLQCPPNSTNPYIADRLAALHDDIQNCHAKLNMIINAILRQSSNAYAQAGQQQFLDFNAGPTNAPTTEPVPGSGNEMTTPLHTPLCLQTNLGDGVNAVPISHQPDIDPQLYNGTAPQHAIFNQAPQIERPHAAALNINNPTLQFPAPQRQWAASPMVRAMGMSSVYDNMFNDIRRTPWINPAFTPALHGMQQTTNSSHPLQRPNTTSSVGANETSRPKLRLASVAPMSPKKPPTEAHTAAIPEGQDQNSGGTIGYKPPTVQEGQDDMTF